MLVSSAFAGSLAELIRHTSESIPEPVGLAIFGMIMFIVSTGIRRHKSFIKSSDSMEAPSLATAKLERHSSVRLQNLHARDVEIQKQLASL